MTSFETFCNYFYSELKTWSLMGMGHWHLEKKGDEGCFLEFDHETVQLIMLPVLARLSQTEDSNNIVLELKNLDKMIRIAIDSQTLTNKEIENSISKNLQRMPGSFSITNTNLIIVIPVNIHHNDDDHLLNIDTIASIFGTTVQEIIPIIDETFKSMDTRLERIRNAIKHNDYETIHREAHSIKGSAMNIQAEPITRYSERLEKTAAKSFIKDNDLNMLIKKINLYKQNYANRKKTYAS